MRAQYRLLRWLTIATFTVTVGLSGAARAEGSRIASLRDALGEIDQRARTVRARKERAPAQLRHESERIVGVVDGKRTFFSTKIELYQMQGESDVTEPVVREMESRYAAAAKLLHMVERWYEAR